jgi:hypothetical protein
MRSPDGKYTDSTLFPTADLWTSIERSQITVLRAREALARSQRQILLTDEFLASLDQVVYRKRRTVAPPPGNLGHVDDKT